MRRSAIAVVVTLTKGYHLDYVWRQVGAGARKDAAGYYFQAAEGGGELPGRWWGRERGRWAWSSLACVYLLSSLSRRTACRSAGSGKSSGVPPLGGYPATQRE
jgi:hypothetical protein